MQNQSIAFFIGNVGSQCPHWEVGNGIFWAFKISYDLHSGIFRDWGDLRAMDVTTPL